MGRDQHNRPRTPSSRLYPAPVVTIFFTVGLILWLLAPDDHLSWNQLLRVDAPTFEGFLTSHLVHLDGVHLIVNCLLILVLGTVLESRWGSSRFVLFYLLCAWGGTTATIVVGQLLEVHGYSCGASSIALGCLLGVGYSFPHDRIWRWLPANKYLVWIAVFVGAALLAEMQIRAGDGGGLGPPYLLPQTIGVPLALVFFAFLPRLDAWNDARRERLVEEQRARVLQIRERVDELLEKISTEGYGSLSPKELSFLRRASKHFSDDPRG